MTPALALLATLTATAQEAPQPGPSTGAAAVYLGAHSGWTNAPLSGGAEAVALLPSLRARLRVAAFQQPGDDLTAVLMTLSEPSDGAPPELQRWLGNEVSAELAWRSPVGLLLGARVDRDQAFSRRGMRYLTDELRLAPDHDRVWTTGPTLGALAQTDRFDVGGQLWLGFPVTTRMTPGVDYASVAETPAPRDLIGRQAELTALGRLHQGAWFVSMEAGARRSQRSRHVAEVLGLGNATQVDPIVRVSAGVTI